MTSFFSCNFWSRILWDDLTKELDRLGNYLDEVYDLISSDPQHLYDDVYQYTICLKETYAELKELKIKLKELYNNRPRSTILWWSSINELQNQFKLLTQRLTSDISKLEVFSLQLRIPQY